MRVLIEIAYVVAGLVAAVVIAALSAWAYPRGRDDIWLVAFVCMIISVLMGIGPIRRAAAADRAIKERRNV